MKIRRRIAAIAAAGATIAVAAPALATVTGHGEVHIKLPMSDISAAAGYLITENSAGTDEQCSGALVGASTFLTAGHCMFPGGGSHATHLAFVDLGRTRVPKSGGGYSTQYIYRCWADRSYTPLTSSPTGWAAGVNSMYTNDWAVMHLARCYTRGGSRISGAPGASGRIAYYGVGGTPSSSLGLLSPTYPLNLKGGLLEVFGTVTTAGSDIGDCVHYTNSVTDFWNFSGAQTAGVTHGSSGGPLLMNSKNPTVVGIVNGGCWSSSNTYYVKATNAMVNRVAAARAGNWSGAKTITLP
ncbi:trypsin-like serine peptidase [Nocardioides montaniterrae]